MVVVCGGALARGAAGGAFSPRDMTRALRAAADRDVVVVVMEAPGRLSLGAACVSARLSPHIAAPRAEVALVWAGEGAGAGEPLLRVELVEGRAAGEELLLWPSAELSSRAEVPHLTPANIRADGMYVCASCGVAYSEPHPLKVHLYLSCGAPSVAAFWRRVLSALAPRSPCPAPAPAAAPRRHSCPWCGRGYSRRYGLVIHCRTHTGARPLSCPTCARRFADPSNLNKHRRLHDRDTQRHTQHTPHTQHSVHTPHTPHTTLCNKQHSPPPTTLTTLQLLS